MASGSLGGTSRAALPLKDLKQSVFGGENTPICNRDKIWKWWCGETKDDCQYCRKIVTPNGVTYTLQSCNDESQLGKGYLLQCGFVPMK